MRSGISSTSSNKNKARGVTYTLLALFLLFSGSCAQAQQVGSVSQAQAHLERGNELKRAGELRAARSEYEAAARLAPESANVRYMLATTLDDLGELQAARQQFERAVALNPNDAFVRSGYGVVLDKLGDKQGSLREQQEANRLKPKDAVFLVALGHAQEQAGEIEPARRSFEQATQLDADSEVHATAYFRLGYNFADQGEPQKAIEALRRGVEIDPSDEYARKRLMELESKHQSPPSDQAYAKRVEPKDGVVAIIEFLESHKRNVASIPGKLLVPPQPDHLKRLAVELERQRLIITDSKLKARIERAMEYIRSELGEESSAFWAVDYDGPGAKKRKSDTPSQKSNRGSATRSGHIQGTGEGTGP